MIRLSGLVPGADVKIDFTGIRPGEKLSEEWRFGSETATETAHAQISCVRPQHIATIDLAAVSYPVEGALYESSTELIFNRMQQLLQEGQPSGAPVPGRS